MPVASLTQVRAVQILFVGACTATGPHSPEGFALRALKDDVDKAMLGDMSVEQLVAGLQYMQDHTGIIQVQLIARQALVLLGAAEEAR